MPPAKPHTSGTSTPNCGYESPLEDHHPAFVHAESASAPTPAQPQCVSSLPVARPEGAAPASSSSAAAGPSKRPVYVSRPSFMTASSPPLSPQDTARAQMSSAGSNPSSLDDMVEKANKPPAKAKVGLRDRIACYQWTYFTMTMATGGVSNVLHMLPYDAPWLMGVGTSFFLLNITLFLTNCVLICTRFCMRPGSFVHSFTDQVESLFIPAFFVSIAIIMINICEYGVPSSGVWLLRTMEILFWVYVGISAIASAGMYLILWSTLVFPVHMMTPTWVFPAYPLLLTAPLAANLIVSADASGHPLSLNMPAVAFGAATTQGTGCLIAFMISAAFIYRLMTQKLPRDMQRPGVFISIGPFGFTAAGIAQLGSQANKVLPPDFLGSPHSADIIRIVSLLVSLWLWGLSMWFFLVSVGSLWKYCRSGHKMPFQMTWWSFVFPNTALVTATQVMGDIFDSNGLRMFGAVMTAILVVVWLGVFATMVHCLRTRKLLWPKDSS